MASKIPSFFLVPTCRQKFDNLSKNSYWIVSFSNFRHCINVGAISSTVQYLKINTHWKWHITERQGCVMGKSTRYLNNTALAPIPPLPFNSWPPWDSYQTFWSLCFLIFKMEIIIVLTSQDCCELTYVNCLEQRQHIGNTQ